MDATTARILQLVADLGIARPRDLTDRDLPHSILAQLHEQGRLERVGRGLYRLPERQPTQHSSLAAVCKRVPAGVVCLLSALRFHDLGTQSPFEVWLAIDPKHRLPRVEYPPIRVVRFSGSALTEGVEEHRTPDGAVRVYSVAKTVVDCFRYRNKVGLDIALEALKACLRERRASVDEVWTYARLLRMSNVMRPYLEATI
jgi:predicted transcriptional regulator of viral defense system